MPYTDTHDGGRAQALVTPQLHDRLAKLCGLFGSEHDGERAEAARQADGLIRRHGLTWRDVIFQPAAEWQHMAKTCAEHLRELSDKEIRFVLAMQKWRRPPSDAQLAWLRDIYERVQVPA